MSQLVGSACAKCHKKIPSILAGEFCPECGKPVHKTCKKAESIGVASCPTCGCAAKDVAAVDNANDGTAQSPAHAAPMQLRPNKLSNKLIVGGIAAVVCGIWWLVDGLTGSFLEEIIGGLVWKGAVLIAAGSGAVYYGYRLMADAASDADVKK